YDYFFFSSRRRHTRSKRDWSSDVCSSDLRLSPLVPSRTIMESPSSGTAILATGQVSAQGQGRVSVCRAWLSAQAISSNSWATTRSEERRVGKECRSRGRADYRLADERRDG